MDASNPYLSIDRMNGLSICTEDSFLPHAQTYYQLLRQAGHQVCERPASYPHLFSERHLQCIWYNPELRPDKLQTIAGESVVVQHPGTWNLEPGPDFLGALLQINGERLLAGDVEIHIDARDWKAHRHHENRKYDGVCAHVTYNAPHAAPELFPPGTIHIALRDALKRMPAFDFDSIDLTAYPYHIPGENTPCRSLLQAWSPSDIQALLSSAGEARLHQKAARMRHELLQTDPDELLYRETLAALGYKNNKKAFRLLAEALPLKQLRHCAAENPVTAYALLAGISGLLPRDINSQWPAEARSFLRTIWDIWWKQDEARHRQTLPRSIWNLSGIRPANHPLRRLMAVASLFAGPKTLPALLDQFTSTSEPFSTAPFLHLFQQPSGTWWDAHLTWSGKTHSAPIRLIGPERAGALCTNVIIPLYIATNKQNVAPMPLLHSLPRESDNAVIRQTAFMLLGRDAPRSLYGNPLCRQGLIQIFHDFCLNDRSRCTTCPLPNFLQQFRAAHGGI